MEWDIQRFEPALKARSSAKSTILKEVKYKTKVFAGGS